MSLLKVPEKARWNSGDKLCGFWLQSNRSHEKILVRVGTWCWLQLIRQVLYQVSWGELCRPAMDLRIPYRNFVEIWLREERLRQGKKFVAVARQRRHIAGTCSIHTEMSTRGGQATQRKSRPPIGSIGSRASRSRGKRNHGEKKGGFTVPKKRERKVKKGVLSVEKGFGWRS